MEIQIMTPSPATSSTTTPYTTAPSSPHRFPNFFYSAPTSPIHSLVNFHQHDTDTDTDFAFNFTENPSPPSLSAADELFYAGKIKPLKHIPNGPVQYNNKNLNSVSETFSQTPGVQDSFTNIFTQTPDDQTQNPPNRLFPNDPSRCFNKNINSFTETFSQTPGEQDYFSEAFSQTPGVQTQNPPKRGRETTTNATRATRTSDKLSRSSSPFRISDILYDEENNNNNNNNKNTPTWYSKWNLKNLILFRSVSEGSARRNKDPVNKYSRITTKCDEGVKNSSFRSVESCRSGVGTSRKVSAHEMHYTANRAVAEEMRRKTYLPYKSGLFGCLGFHNNGTSVHQISKGISSVMKQR